MLRLRSDFDFSMYSCLTSLCVWLEKDVHLTFPTGLKRLCIESDGLCESNIRDVALDEFKRKYRPITLELLEELPKTLKKIKGYFKPASLKERLDEMFPLLKE